jgi:hypothetical protein
VDWSTVSHFFTIYQSDKEENYDAGLLGISNMDLITRASDRLEEVEDEGDINEEENNECGWGSIYNIIYKNSKCIEV